MNFEIAPKSTEIEANLYDAKLYCFALNIGGKTGWRLPTKEELNEIYQSDNAFETKCYWSSTEFNTGGDWSRGVGNGYCNYASKFYGSLYVRAIRDLKTN
jgi:hypothetical protein